MFLVGLLIVWWWWVVLVMWVLLGRCEVVLVVIMFI